MKNSYAKEKSAAQMKALLAVIYAKTDLLITMATGGGKSMLWLVPSYTSMATKSIVVCPFVSLLEEQYKKTIAFGIPCHNYTQSKAVPFNTQILFAQVENCASEEFARYVSLVLQTFLLLPIVRFLASPLGMQFNRVFIDECHDAITGHPERTSKWKTLASRFSSRKMPIILMSATVPPHLVNRFAQAFEIKKNELTEIRSSTDRPEIGMHVVRIPPRGLSSHALNALIRLTDALSAHLDQGERMLVFFSAHYDADIYANKTGSAVYHAKLHPQGRVDNLSQWDQGKTHIMACTTAFAQGIDRPNVRFVVIFKPAFGLITINQMLGRAGRDGKPSHVFFLTVGKVTSSTNVKDAKDRCVKELDVLLNSDYCRRRTNTHYMDGDVLGTPCADRHGIQCDVCDPQSEMQQLAIKAVEPTHAPSVIPQHPQPAFVPASSLLNAAPNVTQIMTQASNLTQGSDDLYGSWQITPFQEEALSAMESNHHAVCAIQSKVSPHPQHPKPIQTGIYKVECLFKPIGTIPNPFPQSSSQPSKDVLSSESIPYSSSVPSNPRSFISRADRHQDITQARLRRTGLLNRYMQVLRGKCPLHFGWQDTLVLEDQHACYVDQEVGIENYSEFKHSFKFPPFTYCFRCGLPQDQKRNGEQPECHAGVSFGRNSSCPFDSFIFKTVFCIWQRDTHRELMKRQLGAPDSWAAFVIWVGAEPGNGQYNNLLEAFLWFCGDLERSKPNFFL
jgi:superfamily II DNA helicase RecQ